MKSVITGVVAGLMLLGTLAAAVNQKPAPQTLASFSDGGPVPLCLPSDPNCKPLIPPAR